MRWSKLKQEVESFAAPKLSGRVRLMATRYRHASDAEGRWALLIDGVEVGGIGCMRADREERQLAEQLKTGGMAPQAAQDLACRVLMEQGHHPLWHFYETVWAYTRSSIFGET
jgi:hypothetical protein